jgi:PleD family two-component response regulator
LSKSFRVTTAPRLSVGIATRFALSDPSPKSLLAEADRALYARKRSRRRRSTDGPSDNDQRLSA